MLYLMREDIVQLFIAAAHIGQKYLRMHDADGVRLAHIGRQPDAVFSGEVRQSALHLLAAGVGVLPPHPVRAQLRTGGLEYVPRCPRAPYTQQHRADGNMHGRGRAVQRVRQPWQNTGGAYHI